VHLLLFDFITNICAISILKVYITSMYNLYCYIFRHFHVIVREFTSAPRKVTQVVQIAAVENVIS